MLGFEDCVVRFGFKRYMFVVVLRVLFVCVGFEECVF